MQTTTHSNLTVINKGAAHHNVDKIAVCWEGPGEYDLVDRATGERFFIDERAACRTSTELRALLLLNLAHNIGGGGINGDTARDWTGWMLARDC